MRVLHLTTEFPPLVYGGLGTAVGGLVGASAAAGVQAGVLLVSWGAGPAYAAPAGELQCSALFCVAPSLNAKDVAAAVRAWEPTLLHLHSFWLWPLARSLRELLGVPIVYTVHSLDKAEYELGGGPGECVSQWESQSEVIAQADRVIALCRSEHDLVVDYCPDAAGRVRIVGNGIDDVAMSRKPSVAPLTVLFVGRFVKRKGIFELIEAIRQVLPLLPQAGFVLAGGHRGSSAADMRHWLLPPELAVHGDRIGFTGWLSQDETARWYRRADLLLVPSWYEPFGMVILEGMLHGVAVAASNVGGPAEMIQHLGNGYLFRPQSADSLAEAILTLCKDETLRRHLAAEGARYVREQWLWPRTMVRMRAVYEEAVAAKGFPVACLPAT